MTKIISVIKWFWDVDDLKWTWYKIKWPVIILLAFFLVTFLTVGLYELKFILFG